MLKVVIPKTDEWSHLSIQPSVTHKDQGWRSRGGGGHSISVEIGKMKED